MTITTTTKAVIPSSPTFIAFWKQENQIKQARKINTKQKNWRRDNLFARHSYLLAASIDAFGSSAEVAWRWNQEGAELKLKQVRRTLAAPSSEEAFLGLQPLNINGRCEPDDPDPADRNGTPVIRY